MALLAARRSEMSWEDKEFVLAAVQQSGDALGSASEELRADKEVVLAAVQQNGDALEYALAELQADKEVQNCKRRTVESLEA